MRSVPSAEPEIIARILGGEKELFHQLIRPYERMVYMAILSVLNREADAEDAAQETMIKAFRHLASFRAEAKFSTWLMSIALNEARSRLRRLDRVSVESLDSGNDADDQERGDFTPAMLTDWREIPSEALERREVRAAIEAAVDELPSIYREVFTLRDLQEIDAMETAQLLGISINLVKVRLYRARMMLQKRLVPALRSFAPRKGIFGRSAWS